MINADTIASELAGKTRTLVLGGSAVILHGLHRTTKDLDVWTDPGSSPAQWAKPLEELFASHADLSAVYLNDESGRWEPIERGSLEMAASKGRLLRIVGCHVPIDVFYHPNEMELSDFEAVWTRATPLKTGLRLPDEIDLAITKQETERAHDLTDVTFLYNKVETALMSLLPRAGYEEAEKLFRRFRSAESAFAATTNPDEKVKQLGLAVLMELARDNNDPFAKERLEQVPDAPKIIPRAPLDPPPPGRLGR